MTFEELQKIIIKNKIPTNVRLESDSGWECDPTDMNGVYYNKDTNTIVFTQNIKYGYNHVGFVCLNATEDTYKIDLQIHPLTTSLSYQNIDWLRKNDKKTYFFRLAIDNRIYKITRAVTFGEFFDLLCNKEPLDKIYKYLTSYNLSVFDDVEKLNAFDAKI